MPLGRPKKYWRNDTSSGTCQLLASVDGVKYVG